MALVSDLPKGWKDLQGCISVRLLPNRHIENDNDRRDVVYATGVVGRGHEAVACLRDVIMLR